ncbi:MAG: malto-oligosyltrehalose synthase, partial [Rhodospirillales bacterium]|nr:malto-oligosyltrehalose synthase [Rhodospirillales bacterium]
MAPPRIPRATYRLQLSAAFTLRDALDLAPYLAELGISHLYLSSFLKARRGSTHGYDIIDHNAINPELGSREDLDRLSEALSAHDMGILMDFIPNHMGVGGNDNVWWLDVLEWGEASPYAAYFDINWQPLRQELRDKVLLPFLGDHYGVILEKGELKPRFDRDSGTLSVWYWEHRHPVAPSWYARLLIPAAQALENTPGGGELAGILAAAKPLSGAGNAARRRLAGEIKQRLADLARRVPPVAEAIDRAMETLGGTPGQPRSFQSLHKLLEAQAYRLSYWRVAADEINYRRFFDINDLAGLHMEEPGLFEEAHHLTFDLLRETSGLLVAAATLPAALLVA